MCFSPQYPSGPPIKDPQWIVPQADNTDAQLVELAQLREQLAAMTDERDAWRVRAERDGAALAAVPIDAIAMALSDAGTRGRHVRAIVWEWIQSSPQKVQP